MRKVLLLLLLSQAACIAEEPDSSTEVLGPDAGQVVEEEEEQPVLLDVHGIPTQTYWDSVPVVGQGPESGSVIIEGSQGPIAVDLGSDGSFCVDMPLEKGRSNSLGLVAIDMEGERSEAVVLEILQDGEPPPPNQALPAKNIALGGLPAAQSTVTVETGSASDMTDGKLGTSAFLSDATFSYDWIIIRNPIADGVEKIRIISDLECPMDEYLLHTAPGATAATPAPGAAESDVGGWTYRGHFGSEDTPSLAVNCSTKDFACQEYNFPSTVVGALGIRFVSDDCHNFFGLGKHRILEIEAWTPPGTTPPSNTAPSCQSGL